MAQEVEVITEITRGEGEDREVSVLTAKGMLRRSGDERGVLYRELTEEGQSTVVHLSFREGECRIIKTGAYASCMTLKEGETSEAQFASGSYKVPLHVLTKRLFVGREGSGWRIRAAYVIEETEVPCTVSIRVKSIHGGAELV